MKNQFGICDRCKGTNVKTLKKALQEIDPNADIDVRCQNLCGIGRTKPFVVVNYVPVIKDNEQELIHAVRDIILKGK